MNTWKWNQYSEHNSYSIQSTATGLQTNANAGISNKCKFNSHSLVPGNKYCQPKQLSPYYRYDGVPFKSQDVFDTKHISYKTL
jgi:hypothetical protein